MDSSVAGIGGCPYAKGASGNVATEDVLYLCELLGIPHGVQTTGDGGILSIGDYISKELGRDNLAKVREEDFSPELIEARRKAIFEE